MVNDKVARVLDSWMPFILLQAFFWATLISLIKTGSIGGALGGILLGLVLIFSLHYIPSKKSKFIFDKEGK